MKSSQVITHVKISVYLEWLYGLYQHLKCHEKKFLSQNLITKEMFDNEGSEINNTDNLLV
jgi:hypothetical protein